MQTWKRRRFRVVGPSLVAYNDVTKRAIAKIDLRKVIAVEDDRSPVLSPASGVSTRSQFDDDRLCGVEHAFRLVIDSRPDQDIVFFADSDNEKQRW